MKSIKLLFALIMLSIFIANLIYATDFKAEQPFLITAAGQGPDVTMVKVLAQKNNLKFTFDKLAKPEKLKDHSTLVIVTGASTKGLGAANIDKDQEMARVQEIIKAAKKVKMKIITMHVGGVSRRGKLSDDFNTITAENADCLIITKNGNEDNFFTKIAEEKKIHFIQIDKILDAGDVMKNIFSEQK